MEDTTWEQKFETLTHILTNPTTNPSLHSQYFIANQIPCYLNWDYPPLLCPKYQHPTFNLRWAFSLFLKRASRLRVSWRSKCPYSQPPPLILSNGVEEAKWDDEGKRLYFRKRVLRKKLQSEVNPVIPVLVPNILLLCLLFWDPFPQ
ncbi:hypothetical protein SOVF_118880 [Spinacia oleracea]|uniref:Uncharacterized protein n=1 Tax=Spinacia oleracea TaxID=3562 RepID=A0A9R0I9C4_SPIOL|nr:uncharacterized protein LOC110784883 [Spinacia oleracea]KNA13199.1 hypothetical protein SOVF_118880 [Spinacia oleracea]